MMLLPPGHCSNFVAVVLLCRRCRHDCCCRCPLIGHISPLLFNYAAATTMVLLPSAHRPHFRLCYLIAPPPCPWPLAAVAAATAAAAAAPRAQIMRTLNISGETQVMAEKRAQNTLELLPSHVRTMTLLCIYRTQVRATLIVVVRRSCLDALRTFYFGTSSRLYLGDELCCLLWVGGFCCSLARALLMKWTHFFYCYFFLTFIFQLVDRPGSTCVVPPLPPQYLHSFTSRRGFGIPNVRRFSSKF